MAVGIARAAFEFACEYSKERQQFGVPIAMQQAVAFMIADMATKVEAGRLLTWQSASLLDNGMRNTLAASHAKRFSADSCMEVATDAVQVYGGYGFIKDYPVEKLMRDAKIMQLYEGTSQIQRLVIAKEVLMGRNVNEPLQSTVANGQYADWYTVYAKTDKELGHRGISAFVVPRDDTVVIDKKEDKLGQRASNTATVTFNETEIPVANLLGEENKGFKLAMMTLDRTRPGVAAMAVGIARAAFEFACEYSKERQQFGVPIAMHQAVAFMIADMATKVEAGRLLTWQSASLLDNGMRNTLAASHAKRFSADSCMEVATDAVQVYGGYGFIKDYPVEKLMRDAKIMQLYEGTSQIQRLVIAKEVLMGRNVNEPLQQTVANEAQQVEEVVPA